MINSYPNGKESSFLSIQALFFLTPLSSQTTPDTGFYWERDRLEIKDGGNTWAPRSIPSTEEEDFNYRFNSISFKGKEGWIIDKSSILFYIADAGENWDRIPLSSQLPGDMVFIKVTKEKNAEMVTDECAIYVTSNKDKTEKLSYFEHVHYPTFGLYSWHNLPRWRKLFLKIYKFWNLICYLETDMCF